jgi:hypothetical protein
VDVPNDGEQVEGLKGATETKVRAANRYIGIVLLLIITIMLFIFGFASEYRPVNVGSAPVDTSSQPIFGGLLILTAIFTVIGFGMLLMYFKKMTESALFTSLFIVSFTVLLLPMAMKFWYNVFVKDFSGVTTFSTGSHYFMESTMGGGLIYWDLYNLKFALICAISQLVVLLAVFGRLGIIQLIVFTIFYNIVWPLNLCALINLQNKSPDTDKRFFDDNQIAATYLFAAGFGTLLMLFVKRPPKQDSFDHSDYSGVFASVGAFFIFATFCCTTILFSLKNTSPYTERNYIWMELILNTFFSLSSNVLTTTALTVLFVGKLKLRWTIFGLIMGGIIYGCVSQLTTNIGAAIACGAGSGLLTVIYFDKVYQILN